MTQHGREEEEGVSGLGLSSARWKGMKYYETCYATLYIYISRRRRRRYRQHYTSLLPQHVSLSLYVYITIRSQTPLATVEMGRTDDVLFWGVPPLLTTSVRVASHLCHSSLGDANRAASRTTNKQTGRHTRCHIGHTTLFPAGRVGTTCTLEQPS